MDGLCMIDVHYDGWMGLAFGSGLAFGVWWNTYITVGWNVNCRSSITMKCI